jgi:hypothetical protein
VLPLFGSLLFLPDFFAGVAHEVDLASEFRLVEESDFGAMDTTGFSSSDELFLAFWLFCFMISDKFLLLPLLVCLEPARLFGGLSCSLSYVMMKLI